MMRILERTDYHSYMLTCLNQRRTAMDDCSKAILRSWLTATTTHSSFLVGAGMPGMNAIRSHFCTLADKSLWRSVFCFHWWCKIWRKYQQISLIVLQHSWDILFQRINISEELFKLNRIFSLYYSSHNTSPHSTEAS